MLELSVGNEAIPYEIRVSPRRRTIAVKVASSGEVTVLAPRYTFSGTIRRFVEKQAPWIVETRKRVMEIARRHPRPEYRQGDTFLFLGKEVILDINVTGVRRYRPGSFLAGRLTIRPPQSARTSIERVVRLTYEEATLRLVTRLVQKHAKTLGVRPASIKISRARGRWGSCSRGSRLRFNWRLAMAPLGLIEYLAVHELGHIKVQGHSKRFWKVVEGQMPGYRTWRKWLRDNGRRLMAY